MSPPHLESALKDSPEIAFLRKIVNSKESSVVRYAAAGAWADIDVKNSVSGDVIFERLKNGTPGERVQAAMAMQRMRDRDEVQARIGPPGKMGERLAKLVETARNGKPAEQIAALDDIAMGGPLVADIAPMIRPFLDAPSAEIARAAAKVLIAMGPVAKPLWFDAAKSRDGYTRRLAIEALASRYLQIDGTPTGRFEIQAVLENALRNPDWLIRKPAAEGLCGMWPASCPALTAAMKSGDTVVKKAVLAAITERPSPILENMHSADVVVDGRVVIDGATTPMMIEFAQQIFQDLVVLARSGDRQMRALESISLLPVAYAEPEMLGRLNSSAARLGLPERERLARQYPELFHSALAGVFEGAYSPDPYVRSICIRFLAAHHDLVRDTPAHDAIKAALSAPSQRVRHEALQWASTLSSPFEGIADPVAQNLLRSSYFYARDAGDRATAAEMLGRFAVDAAVSVPALALTLDDREREPRLAAITALRAFGADAKPALPPLLTLLKTSPDSAIVDAAARTLVVLGPEGARATTAYFIGRLRGDANPKAQIANIAALAQIGPDAAGAVPALEELLAGPNNELRIEVARALGAIGPSATSAIPALTRMVDNRNADVRDAAADALARISPDGKGLGPALMAAVYNHDRTCSDRLAAVLRRAGPSPALQRRLDDLAGDDSDTAVRDMARHASAWLRTNP